MLNSLLPTRRPHLVIFDWDDTLVDNYAAIHAAINATRAHYGMPIWSLEETRQQCRTALNEIFPQWFGDNWQEAKEIFYKVFAAEHIAHLQIKPGAPQLLDALTGAGIPVAVNSNKKNDYLRREVAHLGWEKYFSVLVGAGDVVRGKPAPDGIQLIRQKSGILPPAEAWFVGDNDMDLQTAIAGGCFPILLQVHNKRPPSEKGPVILTNCHEMLDLFKSLA